MIWWVLLALGLLTIGAVVIEWAMHLRRDVDQLLAAQPVPQPEGRHRSDTPRTSGS